MSIPGKAFLLDARKRADEILGALHVSAEVKELVKDLLHCAESLEAAVAANTGQSSDVRVLRKKLDASKGEIRAAETKAETLKAAIMTLAPELKSISSEAANILKADAANASAAKIKASTQKLAEIIIKAGQS
jgi:hypothetical protein